MSKSRILTLIAWMAATFLVVVGCNRVTTNAPATSIPQLQSVNLTVSTAASLKDVMQSIQSTYRQEQPNVTLTYNFGSSGSLQQQIQQGAPVDVFISAAEKQMNALEKQHLLLTQTRKDLLKNEVVLITSKAVSISGFQNLTGGNVKRVAIGDPQSVPAGHYAQEVLTHLKLFDPLKPKLVFAKDVRQVLAYVETGNVDAGLVYVTDAKTSDQVKIVTTAPENSHSPIIYPVAVLKDSKNADAAKEFVQFLSSDQAKAEFEQAGFMTIVQQ